MGTNSNEELNDSDLAISDVEAHNENVDLPDARAWGRDRNRFYSTDYVDPDYGGFQGRDAALAELEEEEAKNLQKQLTQELDDGDFIFDGFAKVDVRRLNVGFSFNNCFSERDRCGKSKGGSDSS